MHCLAGESGQREVLQRGEAGQRARHENDGVAQGNSQALQAAQRGQPGAQVQAAANVKLQA